MSTDNWAMPLDKSTSRDFWHRGKTAYAGYGGRHRSVDGGDIQALDWMSDTTKKQALIKLHAVTNKIGYPDKWKDYSGVEIARDDALGNHLRFWEWAVNYDLNKIGKPVDKGEWSMSPPTVNAYYNPQMNDINFPAGILQPPFYSNHRDEPVNFGAVGAVIGHELTHGFDDEGRQFDAQGNLRDWWTVDDAKRFEDRAACIADEYAEFTAIDELKLNGKLTLGENAADNGGVRLALMSLRRVLANKAPARHGRIHPGATLLPRLWADLVRALRPELARMLATVDPHSPGRLRVNGVLLNTRFSKGVCVQNGSTDGQGERLPDLVTAAATSRSHDAAARVRAPFAILDTCNRSCRLRRTGANGPTLRSRSFRRAAPFRRPRGTARSAT